MIEVLAKYNPDYIILAGFMRILSPLFVNYYKGRIINIHPADTKEYQGAHAYEWAFNKKMSRTKITVHYVDSGVDTGKIIKQADVDLSFCKTLSEVEEKGLNVEHKFYSTVIKELFENK
ncbi:MAG: formyltransferase family protein [Pseudomonadota bacterium]